MANILIRGRVHVRNENESENITSYEKKFIRVEKEFTDPIEFNKSLRSPSIMMDKLTPFEYNSLNDEEYRMTVDFNATQAIDWAEEVASYRDEDTKIDVLSYWLKLFSNMRIRRALHIVLKKEHNIDTNLDL